MHIVLLKCPHVQIAFLKFTSCDNQALVECIPIAAVAVNLNLKHTEFSSVYNNFKCLYKKSLETYWRHHLLNPHDVTVKFAVEFC